MNWIEKVPQRTHLIVLLVFGESSKIVRKTWTHVGVHYGDAYGVKNNGKFDKINRSAYLK